MIVVRDISYKLRHTNILILFWPFFLLTFYFLFQYLKKTLYLSLSLSFSLSFPLPCWSCFEISEMKCSTSHRFFKVWILVYAPTLNDVFHWFIIWKYVLLWSQLAWEYVTAWSLIINHWIITCRISWDFELRLL